MTGLITTTTDGVQVLDFEETKILDQESVDSISGELQAIAQSTDAKKIVIDMNRIELMTSTMIGQFVNFNNQCKERDIAVHFCNLTTQIRELFKITKLDSMLTIAETREKAIASFE